MERFKTWLIAWARRLYNHLCPATAPIEAANEAACFVRRHAGPGWTTADDAKERDLYLVNRTAFWLRPDRHEYGVPCWMVEGYWEPPAAIYAGGVIANDIGALSVQQQLSALAAYQNSALNGYAQQALAANGYQAIPQAYAASPVYLWFRGI